ncbi:type II toxin-antitoxin system HicA family toxin [bacterium]|nr:type II toxin-antitoxin system HicA family toxin [bacterium]
MKNMTGTELVNLLKRNGWVVVRIEGSHHIMKKENNPNTLSIPVHKDKTFNSGLFR